MFRLREILVCFWALCVATACGFQLQGELTTPVAMERTYIATDDRLSPFYRQLRERLRIAGVDVVENDSDATAVLTITFEETSQRVLSVSARNVPTEYEVYYTVAYEISSQTQNLMPNQSITLTRDYTYDTTLVLGKAREEQELRAAIVDDLVRVVLKQISTL